MPGSVGVQGHVSSCLPARDGELWEEPIRERTLQKYDPAMAIRGGDHAVAEKPLERPSTEQPLYERIDIWLGYWWVGALLVAAAIILPLLRQRGTPSWDTLWAEDARSTHIRPSSTGDFIPSFGDTTDTCSSHLACWRFQLHISLCATWLCTTHLPRQWSEPSWRGPDHLHGSGSSHTPSGDTRIVRSVDARPRTREHSHYHEHDVDVSRGAPLGAGISRRTQTRCRAALGLGLSQCRILGTELCVLSPGDRMAHLPPHKGGLHRRRIVPHRTDRPGRRYPDLTTANGGSHRRFSSCRSNQWPSLWRVPFGCSRRVRVVERKLGVLVPPGPSNHDRLTARPQHRRRSAGADHRRVVRTSRRRPVRDSGVGTRHGLSVHWPQFDRLWPPRSLG